jgi:hypothetical protein
MIAVDTSSLRRFLAGDRGHDVDAVADALENRSMVLPPVVLTEILSDASALREATDVLSAIPLLEVTDGYWVRAGLLRGRVIAAGFKSKVADALVAQSCLDHDVALVTHDRDFRHYTRFGLVLV